MMTLIVVWASVNLLNIADMFLTRAALSLGANELNPLISIWGYEWKILTVAVASTILLIFRSKALLAPLVILAAVVTYSAIGIAEIAR